MSGAIAVAGAGATQDDGRLTSRLIELVSNYEAAQNPESMLASAHRSAKEGKPCIFLIEKYIPGNATLTDNENVASELVRSGNLVKIGTAHGGSDVYGNIPPLPRLDWPSLTAQHCEALANEINQHVERNNAHLVLLALGRGNPLRDHSIGYTLHFYQAADQSKVLDGLSSTKPEV